MLAQQWGDFQQARVFNFDLINQCNFIVSLIRIVVYLQVIFKSVLAG